MATASKVGNKLLRVLQSPSPYHIKRINYAVTLVCNAFCRMCDIWRNDKGHNRYPYHEELTADDLAAAFGASPLLQGLDEVSITGGEPFLRADLDEVCLFFLRRFPKCHLAINSNFYLEEATVGLLERLRRAGELERLTLCFSLDGLERTHDRIRGVANGFRQIVHCVKRVQHEFGTPLVLSYTIIPENHLELEPVYELSRELGTRFTFRFADVSERYYGNTRMTFRWQDRELDAVEAQITRIMAAMNADRPRWRHIWSPDLYFFSQLVNYRRNPRRIFTCYSGTHSLYLDSFGNVYPCIMLGSKLGNIKQEAFADIWLSERLQAVRQEIADEKCHCWTECEAFASLQRKLWPHALI